MTQVSPRLRAHVIDVVSEAARDAGRIQRERREQRSIRVTAKGAADITTDVDLACERAVLGRLAEEFRDHAIVSEESPSQRLGRSPYVFTVDPLDGTKNYTHGHRRSAVAIAWSAGGVTQVGVIYNPWSDELFVAARGKGARCNGETVRVSATKTLGRAMVASALTYKGRNADATQMRRLARLLAACEAVRSDGCAALDLCDVAAGRYDAYVEPGLKAWDTAAGALVVREAGGRTSAFDGTPHDPDVAELVASNGRVHTALLRVL